LARLEKARIDWLHKPAGVVPLDVDELCVKLVRPGGPYAGLTVVDRTGSTNADLRAAALDGTVLIAEQQTAGQGRRARAWVFAGG